jgi:hypothetical protein
MERLGQSTPTMALRYQLVMVERQAELVAALDGFARQRCNSGRRDSSI